MMSNITNRYQLRFVVNCFHVIIYNLSLNFVTDLFLTLVLQG